MTTRHVSHPAAFIAQAAINYASDLTIIERFDEFHQVCIRELRQLQA